MYVPVLLVLARGSAVLTLGLACFTVVAWARSSWSLVGRLHYTLVTLAAVALVWFLHDGNLPGFPY